MAKAHNSSWNSYLLSHYLFLRLLALCFAVAFVSLWLEIDGLIGSEGITPAAPYLERVAQYNPGWERFRLLPSLFWLGAGDTVLKGIESGHHGSQRRSTQWRRNITSFEHQTP